MSLDYKILFKNIRRTFKILKKQKSIKKTIKEIELCNYNYNKLQKMNETKRQGGYYTYNHTDK